MALITNALLEDCELNTEIKWEEPNSFNEAWHHQDLEERKKWREAVGKEFHDMESRNVYTKIQRSEMPKIENV